MRNGKDLILASKEFASENRFRSWWEVLLTLFLTGITLTASLLDFHLAIRILASITTGFLYVRLFVIYHDYEHRAILQNSKMAEIILSAIGVYLLAPPQIWKRSHEYHHNNNSKLTISGIGSYPTICTSRFVKLTSAQKQIYLINRHPLTVIFGYFTLFIYWLNLKSFIQSPGKHLDSLLSLVLHVAGGTAVWYYFGATTFLIAWFVPFFIAFGTGSYLFYAQHNFPGAKFKENPDWTYVHAAMSSTSFMVMNPVMQWFTGNIGYHHIHHINSRIPFYRLMEAYQHMPELLDAPTTSLSPLEIIRCFRLKLWDERQGKMVTMEQFKKSVSAHKFQRENKVREVAEA